MFLNPKFEFWDRFHIFFIHFFKFNILPQKKIACPTNSKPFPPTDGGTPNPLTIQKTTQALITAIGKADAPAGQVSMAVGVIGDYLSKAGY